MINNEDNNLCSIGNMAYQDAFDNNYAFANVADEIIIKNLVSGKLGEAVKADKTICLMLFFFSIDFKDFFLQKSITTLILKFFKKSHEKSSTVHEIFSFY